MVGRSSNRATIDLAAIVSLRFDPPLLLNSDQASVESYLRSNSISYRTQGFEGGATEIDCGGIRYKFRFDEDNNYAIGISRNKMPFRLINWPKSLSEFEIFCTRKEISYEKQSFSKHTVMFDIQGWAYFYFEDTRDQAVEADFDLTFIEIMRRPKAGFPPLATLGRE